MPSPSRISQRRLMSQLEREHLAAIRRAFRDDFRAIQSRVNVTELTRLIAAGDLDTAVSVMGIAPSALRDFERRVIAAFEDAGSRYTALLPRNVRDPRGQIVQFRFNVRHPRAEEWISREAAGLVTRIVDDQRDAIRAALLDGLRQGEAPRTTALRIVGRIDASTGRRAGGIIGLTEGQSGYLANARRYLETGDRQYFQLTLRDRRFDGAIRRAFDAGEPVPAATRDRAVTQYSNRLLRHRGEMVARTETLNALRAGRHMAFAQGAESAGVPDQFVSRKWDASNDSDTRETHAAAEGQTVTGANSTFTVGGFPMRYPGDGSLGAPARETIACRCVEVTEIDFIGAELARRGGG